MKFPYIKKFYRFATFSEGLKKIERFRGQFYWRDYPKPHHYESVGDHSWRLALLVLILEKRLENKIDITKALKMAIIHDLPEILAGDDSPVGEDGTGLTTYAYDEKLKVKRHQKEKLAAKKLFGMLPKEEGKELLNLWTEIETEGSQEARVVKGLDKIEAMLQVLEYRKGHLFKDHLNFTIKYGSKGAKADKTVEKFAEEVASELTKLFKEFKKGKFP